MSTIETTTTTTIITTTTMNESIDNHSDEINNTTMDDHEFGTENTAFLDAQLIEVVPSELNNSLPDLELFLKDEEIQEPAMNVTHFRALNETRKSTNKFERINILYDSSLDTSTDTNE